MRAMELVGMLLAGMTSLDQEVMLELEDSTHPVEYHDRLPESEVYGVDASREDRLVIKARR